MIQPALKKIFLRNDLTREEMTGVMEQIMTGGATDAQIGAFLAALAMKGETEDEITGAAAVMRAKATKIPVQSPGVVDTCGTGGDGSHTFNISTAAALVAAGAGARVAKHGNRAMSSACGSADVLKALGVNIDLPPEEVARCVDTVGIGFLFAPALHTAMKYAIGPRREMGVRTIFNILGPLTNPAGARRQVLGVFDAKLTEKLARVLKALGSEHVLVVHGQGLDEITPCGVTKIAELKNGRVRAYTVSPADFKIPKAKPSDLTGGDAMANADILRGILNGEPGPRRNAVLLNAGAALYVSGGVKTLREGVAQAAQSIDGGHAKSKLDALVKYTCK